jgi:uncharacterized phage protein (predicted DNA packaging)
MTANNLLPKVKAHLILSHDEDDGLLLSYIAAAVSYAESYQHVSNGYYEETPMPSTTEQAVIMLSSYFYESRDGSTAAFLRIVCRPANRYGILSICFFGLTGIGWCDKELWENEYLY